MREECQPALTRLHAILVDSYNAALESLKQFGAISPLLNGSLAAFLDHNFNSTNEPAVMEAVNKMD